MRKLCLILITLLGIFLLSSCSSMEAASATSGLFISASTTSVGALDGGTAEQELTYSVIIQNDSTETVFLAGLEPVLVPKLQDRMLTETVWVPLGRQLTPGESVEVESALLFDATDLSKSEISNMAPLLRGVEITTEQFLPLEATGGSPK